MMVILHKGNPFFLARCFLILFLSFFLTSFSAEARGKNNSLEFTNDLTGAQPYSHQRIEAEGKKGVSVFGQAYRPRPDLFVMELNAFPGGETEIKSVKLKDASGNVIEGKIRRLPLSFMPTARRNYQILSTSRTDSPSQDIRRSSGNSV